MGRNAGNRMRQGLATLSGPRLRQHQAQRDKAPLPQPPGQHSGALLSVSLQLSFLGFCLSPCQAGGRMAGLDLARDMPWSFLLPGRRKEPD